MADNIIRPSTAMLPMVDIATELREKHDFAKTTDTVKDTARVDGVLSSIIAVAATENLDGTPIAIVDRETVKNSLMLNGKQDVDFLSKSEAVKIEEFGDKMASIFSGQLQQMKDELYQLRGQLVKQGLVNENTLYSGFQDFFRNDSIKFVNAPICGITQDVMGPNVDKIIPEAPTEFKVGDWFVVNKTFNGKTTNHLVKVVADRASDPTLASGEIKFFPPLNDLAKSGVQLYKSLGQYNKGSFSFSKIEKDAVIEKEKQTMLNDDTNTTALTIDTAKAGYAVVFKVPDHVAGALTKFTVKAKANGSPGAMVCYVIKESAVSTFKNIADAESKGDLIAISKPVIAAKAPIWSMIDFEFQDPVTGTYPTVSGEKYCFIIEALAANKNGDNWELLFSYYNAGGTINDLQKNNLSYVYKEIPATELDPTKRGLTLSNNISNYDMFFILTTKEIAPEFETAYQEGLYTAKVTLPAPIDVSRARLMLRINREGNYVVTSSPGVYGNNNAFTIGVDPEYGTYNMVYGSGIAIGDKIAIGNNARVAGVGTAGVQVSAQKGLYVDEQVPVYRIGYDVSLRAVNVVWDQTALDFVESNDQYHAMPLVAIIPDGNKVAPNFSDRLLFETEFDRDSNGLPLYANTFEIQIKWSQPSIAAEIINLNKELIGKMFDLSLSFDKSL